jgi:hypothetical protein
MHFYFFPLILLLFCAIVHSCTHRNARARIINRTGVKIEFLTLAHTYSDNYKNAKIFSNIEPNSISNGYLIVDYHTGFMCYGTDWWWLTWTDSNNQVHTIDLKDDRCPNDGENPASQVSSKISTRDAELYIDKNEQHGASSQSTCGYKSYMLESEDDGKYVNIYLHPYSENGIEFETPSGKSTTDYTSRQLL